MFLFGVNMVSFRVLLVVVFLILVCVGCGSEGDSAEITQTPLPATTSTPTSPNWVDIEIPIQYSPVDNEKPDLLLQDNEGLYFLDSTVKR